MQSRTLRLVVFWGAFALVPALVSGQSTLEAWRYSTTSLYGTARGIGVGGAMSAVGADFTSVVQNPAGLGLFRRSELSFTAQLRQAENASTFLDGTADDSRSVFGVGQVGYAQYTPIIEAGEQRALGWKSWAFALSYTQLENHNRNTRVFGFNPYNSIADFFSYQANLAGSFDNGVRGSFSAYDAFIFDDPVTPGVYQPSVTGNTEVGYLLEERGRTGQWNISVAGNFSDVFYVGGSIGIVDISNRSRLTYTESDVLNVYQDSIRNDSNFAVGPFSDLLFTEDLVVTGIGINLNVGIIVQPTDYLRLSVAFQSPTWSQITTSYDTQAYLYDDSNIEYPGTAFNSEVGEYRYNLVTPYKFTLGAMGLVGKYGFLSADVEFIDYRNAQLSQAANFSADFQPVNDEIETFSASATNLRLGGELKLDKLYLRGGFAHFGALRTADGEVFARAETYNPLDGSVETARISSDRTSYSGGIGYRGARFSIDIAYLVQEQAQSYNIYSLQPDAPDPSQGIGYAPVVTNEETLQRAVVTVAYRLPN